MQSNQARLPAVFQAQLKLALRQTRVGDYKAALQTLQPFRSLVPAREVDPVTLRAEDGYFRLRLATLFSELMEPEGTLEDAQVFLDPYKGLIAELREQRRTKEGLVFEKGDPYHKLMRQKLYYLWQQSVWAYRSPKFGNSREYLDCALDLAKSLVPQSQALLAQLYYGAGKLAFRECNESEAMAMYQDSLMAASQRLDAARKDEAADPAAYDGTFLEHEAEAARYSVAKTLALGLGQCLREQGRLEEAHTQVVAGRLLLNLRRGSELAQYARLLLGSIERTIAGDEHKPELLDHAVVQISECAPQFASHQGDIGYRFRLESALVTMQKGEHAEAGRMLQAMLAPTPAPKWVAEVNIGLSRAARRLGQHGDAVKFANAAVDATRDHGLERIKRRAHTVLVLALYSAATADGVDKKMLNETLREIDWALAPSWASDVRTRANLLLTKVRALKAKGDVARALETLKEFEAIEPQVEIGRITELAATVRRELGPALDSFRCPADRLVPNYKLEENKDAVRDYVILKATRDFKKRNEQADALGITRASLQEHVARLKLSRP